MSTFKGVVEEFPDIRIDYFRNIQGRDTPLACFLSHAHSDHLQGLESFHSTFIYCSPATREFLLRLEKSPHRMNFHRGILESRKQHYKHLTKLLKTIALNTPTEVELKLERSLRVTLLDANHCVGAVMFLIEDDSKAVLYTGDIRSESWWVNSLVRNPAVLPYTHGLKRLDKLYLDTTFASKKYPCQRFPTKADGLKELLEKVSKYPIETVFHLHAWTFGYEDIWLALSSFMRSQIHVDEYKYSLYKSLGTTTENKNLCHEGSALYGFDCGNKFQAGCLTRKQNVRLHSCQHDMGCSALKASNVVFIRPIISRSVEGRVLPEVGVGGGGGDLNQVHELELDDATAVKKLIELCTKEILDAETRSNTINLIVKAKNTQKMFVPLDTFSLKGKLETIPLAELPRFLAELVVRDGEVRPTDERVEISSRGGGAGRPKTLRTRAVRQELPRNIEFPYSRHSSYEELCDLVKAFEPIDVYPCTVDDDYTDLNVSIEYLFGHLCFGSTFAHDEEMKTLASQREILRERRNDGDSQNKTPSRDGSVDQHDKSQMRFLGSPSDPELHAFDDLERMPKRARTSPSLLGHHQGDLDKRLPIEFLSPNQKLLDFKKSLESYLGQSKREKVLSISKSADPPCNHIATFGLQESCSAPRLRNDLDSTTFRNERSANCPVDVHRGTHAEPIELSDGEPSSQGNDAGNFLLQALPEPAGVSNSPNESQSDVDTQVTLSDAAFESQSWHNWNPDIKAMRLKQRKEAYKAAKEPSGGWEVDRGLISSKAHHGEEEVEL